LFKVSVSSVYLVSEVSDIMWVHSKCHTVSAKCGYFLSSVHQYVHLSGTDFPPRIALKTQVCVELHCTVGTSKWTPRDSDPLLLLEVFR